MTPIRILLVDDHTLVREALAAMLDLDDDFEVVGQAGDAREAISLHAASKPDIVLLDGRMPDQDGFYVLEQLSQQPGAAQVIMLATSALSHELRRARDLGARGYLPKQVSREQLSRAVRLVHQGKACWEYSQICPSPYWMRLRRVSWRSWSASAAV
jgi:two-component system, NarL family, response regulator DesR